MNRTAKLYRSFLITFIFVSGFQMSYSQEKKRDSILEAAEKHRSYSGSKKLNGLVTNAQKDLVVKNAKDSLYAATLYLLEAESLFYGWDVPLVTKKFNLGLSMCPKNDEGQILKAEILLSSSYMDAPSGFEMIAYTKNKKALTILENLESTTPPGELLMPVYQMLMTLSSIFGNTSESEVYRFKAEEFFNKNSFEPKADIDFYNSNIMTLYKTEVDEETILFYVDKMKAYPNKKYAPLYKYSYASSLNRLTEYYYRSFKRGNKTALKKGYKVINTVLEKYKDDKDMNYYKRVELYFKCEFLLAENKLQEALKTNELLLSMYNKKDRNRIMYENLPQRLRILLKLKRVEESKKLIYKTLEVFHNSKDTLKKDYSNFSPKNTLIYTYIFLDVSDAFNQHRKINADVNETVTLFNKLSLIQFQNSIQNKLTTPKTRALFKRIVSNLIEEQKYGYNEKFNTPKLLETIENVENTLDWQEFLQQRAYTQSDVINDYKYEESALRNKLVKARQKNQDSAIVNIELQLNQLKNNFKEANPDISKFSFSNFSTEDFRKKLQDKELTLRYMKVADSLYVFAIDAVDTKIINLGASKEIKELSETYLTNLTKRADDEQISKTLYTKLIPELAQNFDHINIVPDSYLFKLPFETLKNTKGKYLIEEKSIIYAPYTSLLKYEDKLVANKTESNVMIFTPSYDADPLSSEEIVVRGNEYRLNGAKKESELIAKIFNNKSFSNYNATKENFKKHAPNGQLLHLSMHAAINPSVPQLSHLVFTEGNTDNKLYLEELYGMNLNASMAVLSACNTGTGVIDDTKGAISLHRAFTQAGVPTTVSSLWSAPDSATQQIMVNFYEELKSGKTKAKALQLAKLNYLENTKNAELRAPFYWAGFVINGNNNPVSVSNSSFDSITLWTILIAGLLIFIVFVIHRKNKIMDK